MPSNKFSINESNFSIVDYPTGEPSIYTPIDFFYNKKLIEWLPITGTSYTITNADNNKALLFVNESEITVNTPTGLTKGIAVQIVKGVGSGNITLVSDGELIGTNELTEDSSSLIIQNKDGYTYYSFGGGSTGVDLSTNQTIGGTKTFTSPINISTSTSTLLVGTNSSGTNTLTLMTNTNANRSYTFSNVGVNGTVMIYSTTGQHRIPHALNGSGAWTSTAGFQFSGTTLSTPNLKVATNIVATGGTSTFGNGSIRIYNSAGTFYTGIGSAAAISNKNLQVPNGNGFLIAGNTTSTYLVIGGGGGTVTSSSNLTYASNTLSTPNLNVSASTVLSSVTFTGIPVFNSGTGQSQFKLNNSAGTFAATIGFINAASSNRNYYFPDVPTSIIGVGDYSVSNGLLVRNGNSQSYTNQSGLSFATSTLNTPNIVVSGQNLVLPKMTTTVRDAISSPVEGQLIYNTTTKALNFYNGTAWV